MRLDKIVDEVQDNFSPLAWDRVTIKLFPILKKNGFSLGSFKGDIEVDADILKEIDDCLKSMYGKGLSAKL